MPTYEWLDRFGADLRRLTPAQRAAFRVAVAQLVADLRAGGGFRKGLRVKGVQGAAGVFEMTWAPDGRATFHYGVPVTAGDVHVVWRRIGTHAVLNRP